MLEIKKNAEVDDVFVNESELNAINQFTLKDMTSENVYAFKVVACGNDIDRDGEAFSAAALQELSDLFVGKTVISDHNHKADSQKARIYRAEVVDVGGIAKTGEPKKQLIVYCYMAVTESNKDLIAEIDAGIKKEVSVSCALKRVICSVCGVDNHNTYCEHFPGKEYNGSVCYKRLEGAVDAYELSFVAIPAQPEAGVTKKYYQQAKKELTVFEKLKQKLEETR